MSLSVRGLGREPDREGNPGIQADQNQGCLHRLKPELSRVGMALMATHKDINADHPQGANDPGNMQHPNMLAASRRGWQLDPPERQPVADARTNLFLGQSKLDAPVAP